MQCLLVSGSSGSNSLTKKTLELLSEKLTLAGAQTDLWDLAQDPIPLFDIDTVYQSDYYHRLVQRASSADVVVLGTPDYHGTISSTLKNFLDHLWKEMAGKLIGTVVASYDKGLTVADHIRTVARQYYSWVLPYGVAFQEKKDMTHEGIPSQELDQRLDMMAHDIVRYGQLLSQYRLQDLKSSYPGFLAHYRKPAPAPENLPILKVQSIDHVTLVSADFAKSREFYSRILGMNEVTRPDFSFPGLWFQSGSTMIHLNPQSPEAGQPGWSSGATDRPRGTHIAFRVADAHDAAQSLQAAGINILFGPRKRPDGATQFYIEDPDGHLIEICDLP